MSRAAAALLSAYPGRFTPADAEAWVAAKRQLLLDRSRPGPDLGLAVSSGCAATGARAHARKMADAASHALSRLDAGVGPRCESCDEVLAFDRLETAPAAVRCTGCVPPHDPDTRWCR